MEFCPLLVELSYLPFPGFNIASDPSEVGEGLVDVELDLRLVLVRFSRGLTGECHHRSLIWHIKLLFLDWRGLSLGLCVGDILLGSSSGFGLHLGFGFLGRWWIFIFLHIGDDTDLEGLGSLDLWVEVLAFLSEHAGDVLLEMFVGCGRLPFYAFLQSSPVIIDSGQV
jgi:hypothetical protein